MSALEAVLCIWAFIAAGFSCVAWRRLRPRPAPPERAHWPNVLLLRPVDAPSPAELEALGAYIDYPAHVHHAVLSPAEPALPPGVRWVHSDPTTRNRKVGHLLRGVLERRRPEAVVLAIDADVHVDGPLVKALVDEALRGAALAWAAPVPRAARSLWARAERGLLTRSHHGFAALDAMAAGAPTACGKAMALGEAALRNLPSMAGCIGEDLELAATLHAAGGRVVRARALARVASSPAPLDRYTRWMQVLRAHRPALLPSVPLLLAPGPVLLVLLPLCGAAPALAAAAMLVLARTLLAVRQGGGGPAWEWLLGEALLLAAFARAAFRRTVAWRGRRFALGRRGQMTPVPP